MAELALKKLEDQLNCPVCLDTYTDPKQLQCNHVYCQKCLGRLVVRNQQGQSILTCPNCRQVTPVPANGVAGLPAAFQISHFLDISSEHKKAKEGALYCADHQERELELYCESCEQLICLQCTITEHHGHNYNLVKDVFQKHKLEIVASLAPAKEQLAAISKASERVNSRKRQVLDQQATLEANIHQDSRQLIDAISARTQELVSKLQHITEEKLRCLDSQMEQLEVMKTQLSSYLDMVEETLATGVQGKVVSMKTAITRQVNELTTSLQTDTLEPITPADMKYSTADKAVEVCQNYGAVGVLGSLVPSMCQATGKGLEVATVGETSSAILQAVNFKGQPCEGPILSSECELVSDITGSRARGSVERRGQSKYEINYQPTIKGRHQLHVKVEGQHIRGSPFDITVKLPVEKLGAPMLSIGGVERPWDVAINQRGKVVVTEWYGHCVSVFSPSGEKLRSFGTRGSGQGQFAYPAGVAVDGDNNILVADYDNRIQKFTSDGQFLTAVGTRGNGLLQFSYPMGITVNSNNHKVYVADAGNHRVQVLNSDLTFSGTFGKKGSGKGQFVGPVDVACDSTGNVYVADGGNHRVQVFTAEGKFLRMFGRRGKGRGELECPHGVTVDYNDLVYVSEQGNNCVSVFTCEGQFVTSFGRRGAGKGEFNLPTGTAVDSSGVVYVCDYKNNRVQLF